LRLLLGKNRRKFFPAKDLGGPGREPEEGYDALAERWSSAVF
jgi:hypothetical protein